MISMMGQPIYASPFCIEYVGDHIPLIPISKNRSRRIWKKLVKRRRLQAKRIEQPTAYMTPRGLFAHPSIIAALKKDIPLLSAIPALPTSSASGLGR